MRIFAAHIFAWFHMPQLVYTTTLPIQKNNAWQLLWSKETYPIWAKAFGPGTFAVSDWAIGSKLFIVNDKGNGALALIEVNKPNELLSFRHIAWTQDWKELPADLSFEIDGKTMRWIPITEHYALHENNETTTLTITLEGVDGFGGWEDYFDLTYTTALHNIEQLSQKLNTEIQPNICQ